jgi:hypothetical protein
MVYMGVEHAYDQIHRLAVLVPLIFLSDLQRHLPFAAVGLLYKV